MKLRNIGSLVLFSAVALTTASWAADPPASSSLPSSIVVHAMDGKTSIVPIDTKMAKELLASPNTKQLSTGVVIFVANGKTYMTEDHKMANGKMMIQALLDYIPPEGGG